MLEKPRPVCAKSGALSGCGAGRPRWDGTREGEGAARTPPPSPKLNLAPSFHSSQLAASTSTPADYLAALPPAPEFSLKNHPIAAAELARAASGAPAPPGGLDTTRYRLDPPARPHDVAAWRAALDNARAQLEHQAGRLLNLELLAVHGPRAAAAAGAHTEAALEGVQKETERLRAAADAVNRARKLAHQKAAGAIDTAEAEWASTVAKCGALEREVAALEKEVEARKPEGWGVVATGLPALPGEEEEGADGMVEDG